MQSFTRSTLHTILVVAKNGTKPSLVCNQALFKQQTSVYGLIRVRSPLLTESRLIYFPLATEMFHFAKFSNFKRNWFPSNYMRINGQTEVVLPTLFVKNDYRLSILISFKHLYSLVYLQMFLV
jgi:hypothetical protein